ncbi:MAG: 3-hydroxyacyl-ACP dehydratase FabZ [Syntrophomonadaceae bacterium]
MRFFMLDKITEWKPGQSARGIKNISMSEDFFEDHFPEYPIMPGVLIVEALAQLSGLLLEETVERNYNKKLKALVTILEKVKFRNIAKPGDTLELSVEIISVHEDSGKVHTTARSGDKKIAETEMTFVLVPFSNEQLEIKRRKLLDFWLQDVK